SLAFAPDGRRLISGLADSTLLVWDVGPRKATPVGTAGAQGTTKAWADPAGTDARRALRARATPAPAPDEANPLCKQARPRRRRGDCWRSWPKARPSLV